MAFPTAHRRNSPLRSEVSESKLHFWPIFFEMFPWIKSVEKQINFYNPPLYFLLFFRHRPAPQQCYVAKRLVWAWLSYQAVRNQARQPVPALCSSLSSEELFKMTEPQTADHLCSQDMKKKAVLNLGIFPFPPSEPTYLSKRLLTSCHYILLKLHLA